MGRIFNSVQRWWVDEEGVTSIEYVMLASLIALVIIVSVNAVGFQVCQRYKSIAEAMASAIGTTASVTCN